MLGDVEPHAAWKLLRAQSEAKIPQCPSCFIVPSAKPSRFPSVARLCSPIVLSLWHHRAIYLRTAAI